MRVKKIIFMIAIIIACILIYSVNAYAVSVNLDITGEQSVEVNKSIQLKAEYWTGNDIYMPDQPNGGIGETSREDVTNEASWESSNTNIATVDSKGKVTGIAEGTTTITATYSATNASYEITVKKQSPYSKTIYYLEVTGEIMLPVGETTQMQAKYWEQEGIFEVGKTNPIEIKDEKKNEADVTNKVTWKSSDSSIATVDSKGIVKGIKAGTVKISAEQKIGDLLQKQEHTIEVKSDTPPTQPNTTKLEIRAENGANTVNKDGTIQLKVMRINAEQGANMEEDVTNVAKWTSSNPLIATVDSKGLVKGLKAGKVTITAKYTIGGVEKEAKYEVTVQEQKTTEQPADNPQPKNPGTSGDNTTTKDPIPKTGMYGNLIIAIAVVIPIISFAIYRKYKEVE